jgi:fatty acid desaturase
MTIGNVRTGGHTTALDHTRRTARMLVETAGVSAVLLATSLWCWQGGYVWAVWLLAVPRGLWLQRHYCVGHESSHRKLFPDDRRLNAVIGQLYLLPILTPLAVFRKIHMFHHGHNRRNPHTSALDVVWIPKQTWYWRVYAWLRWLSATYLGGWFWHGLLSILLFLLLPVSVARHISPAFVGWSTAKRAESVSVFILALTVFLLPVALGGVGLWLACWGAPLVVFAWFYAAHLYVYHYRTSIGPNVHQHARRLGGPLVSWWLLNLNHHDVHHAHPSVVWYAIPDAAGAGAAASTPAPVEYGSGRSLWWGVWHQLRGPLIFTESAASGPTPRHETLSKEPSTQLAESPAAVGVRL